MFTFVNLLTFVFIVGLLFEDSNKRYDNIRGLFWLLIIIAFFSAMG